MVQIEKLCRGCMREMENYQRICPMCGYDNEKEEKRNGKCLPEHTILKGRYLLGRVLGEGGFGITYLALDLQKEKAAAIKEYFPVGLASRNSMSTGKKGETLLVMPGEAGVHYREGLRKFTREGQTLAKLKALPGIVSTRDFFFENETAYLVMDYVEGQSLKEYMLWYRENSRSREPMEYKVALALLEPVIYSLSRIHQAGIIHRDISPDNILVDDEAKVTLIDFGAARQEVRREEMRSMTIMVKRGYAPEEQYRTHGEQGPWTDIYALCATLYHMISGQLPEESIERLYRDEVVPLKDLPLSEKVPEQISDVIEKGMAVRKEKRYQSMEELHQALQTALEAEAKRKDEEKQKRQEEEKQRQEREKAAKEKRQEELRLARERHEKEEKERDKERKKLQDEEKAKRIAKKKCQEDTVQRSDIKDDLKSTVQSKKQKLSLETIGYFSAFTAFVVIIALVFMANREGKTGVDPNVQESAPDVGRDIEFVETEILTEVQTESNLATTESQATTELTIPEQVTETVSEKTDREGTQLVTGDSTEAESETEPLQILPESTKQEAEDYYNEALEVQKKGKIAQAAILFGKAGDYMDAEERSFELWKVALAREGKKISASPSLGSSIVVVNMDKTAYKSGRSREELTNWSDIISVSTYAGHTLGLKEDGTVVSAGTNLYGECEVSNWSGIVSVSAGWNFSVGLKKDGTVVAVGDNSHGQCEVAGWSDVIAVSAGSLYTLGLKSDGTVLFTGNNYAGDYNVSDWDDIVMITARYGAPMGIQEDGRVVFKNKDIYEHKKLEEVLNWEKVYSISRSITCVAGLKLDGTVVVNGLSERAQAVVNSWENVVEISAGTGFLAARTSEGKILIACENEETAELLENDNLEIDTGSTAYTDFMAAQVGEQVVIEAYVQAKESLREGKVTFYARDKDGAYYISNMNCSKEDYEKLTPGVKIQVQGTKFEKAGEIQIVDAKFEFLNGDEYLASAKNVTELLGKEGLLEYQNQYVEFNGLTVEPIGQKEGKEMAFFYGYDGSGTEGDDLYFNASINGKTYTFSVNAYLCGPTTEVYSAVKALQVGDKIKITGFLNWYVGAMPEITEVDINAYAVTKEKQTETETVLKKELSEETEQTEQTEKNGCAETELPEFELKVQENDYSNSAGVYV